MAFRTHSGFEYLVKALDALAWKPCPDDITRDEWQLHEVQLAEGQRLWFEVLAWAMDRGGEAYFRVSRPVVVNGLSHLLFLGRDVWVSLAKTDHQERFGYASLLPAINSLDQHGLSPRVFSLLLAHIFDNNYALLSLFQSDSDSIDTSALGKVGDLRLRWPAAIPLLWAYVLGPPPSAKGKERAVVQDLAQSGQVEKEASPTQQKLMLLFFRVLLLAARSIPNLYLIKSYLPQLGDFLITRLYGWRIPRHFDDTFPPREEWFANVNAVRETKPEWTAPTQELKEVYLALLKRVLEAGTNTEEAWRLFSLVRKVPVATRASTPQPDTPNSTVKPFRGKAPLKISIDTPVEGETLDAEVLDLIQKAMARRNPNSFVFRSSHDDDCGIDIPDVGKPWPSSTRGFFFSCWIRISKLNEAITLLHLSQKDQPFPLLQIRILENSQIGITTSGYSDTKAPEEVVCGSPHALLPHGEWVHFAAGCRKGRSATGGGGEARFYINGTRVGAVRVAYPTPKPGLKLEHQKRFEGIRINVGRRPIPEEEELQGDAAIARTEENEWLLGRALMLDEVINEDLVMLMYRLGPRYHGNFQEALGKFLTYENATAINVHLHVLAQAAKQKTLALLPSNSAIVRAVKTGPAIPEDSIVFSLNAKDKLDSDYDHVLNAAIPHASRAKDFKFGRGRLHGAVFPFYTTDLDVGITTVGGAVVALKMIDMARTSDELATTIQILHDMTRDCWETSEEMERIHGYELLAAILRPKMKLVNDSSAQTILSILGVDENNPEDAVVNNSTAYRALALEFELWALAKPEVQKVYFQHFEALLSNSKHKRYNLLRTFQRSNIVRKLLFALRSGLYDSETLPMAVATLKTTLTARWSAEDALKPTFAYLVSALCQSECCCSVAQIFCLTSDTPPAELAPSAEPSASQLPAALILDMIAELLTPKRTIKLAKAISLPRLLVIFLQTNQAPYVVVPCLSIVQKCLATPRLDSSFQQKFESEGGFILLARSLAPNWDDAIQKTVFAILGPGESLAHPNMIVIIMAALDLLLQTQQPASASADSVRSLALSASEEGTEIEGTDEYDDRLENLLTKVTVTYRSSAGFRKALSSKRLDSLLPNVVDFATVSASSEGSGAERQRQAITNFLEALIELSKAPSTVINQMQLCVEQLRAASGGDMSASVSSVRSLPASAASSPLRRSASLIQRLSSPRRTSSRRERPVLKRVLTGESLLEDGRDKNAAWRQIILKTDMQRHSAMILDRKEHWHRVAEVEWPRHVATLRTENGIWADEQEQVKWRLDGSEGPLRMRGRLERIQTTHRVDHKRKIKVRDAIPAPDELCSAISRINDAPWDDPFALAQDESLIDEGEFQSSLHTLTTEIGTGSATGTPTKATFGSTGKRDAMDSDEDEEAQEVEDDADDKTRLIAKSLQAGDVIESAHNIVRIVGVDALPGLLILGKRNLYLIDGLVQTPDGQVVEADQAPRDVLTIPSGTLADFDPNDQRSHRWPYAEVVEINKRAFLFRDVALELYFQDKQNFLVVFRDKKQRSLVTSRLNAKLDNREGFAKSVLGSLLRDTVANVAKAMDTEQLEVFTRRWQNRQISNFAYLQMLNQHANRTPNDVTQYPVFPWVIADYDSQTLDLGKPETFRDLSLPMGALSEARREAAAERYQATEGVGEPPFHYGTHYSSSMIVCGYMIRLSPFTEIFLALQGGTFDLADRLFSSIPRAWDSASRENRGDVRELIPEFFYSPAFLKNTNHLDLGKKQVTGDEVNDVALPPWAMDDPSLFVHWNREALESDYVSRHLPAWIDLIFGFKQRDPSAFNCFHPLSYRGAVDLDAMTDEGEKAASTAIIHNFGQTPRQIFKAPHPQRVVGSSNPGADRLPVGTKFGVAEHWQLMFRSALPVVESKYPIHHIDPRGNDKPSVQQEHRLPVPEHTNLSLQFGFADDSMRVYCQETGQKVNR